MRKAISILLALVICFSLACTVSAAANSPAQGGTPVSTGSSNPKTGDTANMELWVPVMGASALALVAVVFVYTKKSRKV